MPTFELDERGYFWWADEPVSEGHFAPESAVTGQIQVGTNGAAKLILDDVLPRTPGRPNLQYGTIPGDEAELAVVGLIRRGQAYVRLEQLSQAGLSFGSARRTSETLKARMCVQGRRLIADLPPNGYGTAIRLSLAGFDEWLQPSKRSLGLPHIFLAIWKDALRFQGPPSPLEPMLTGGPKARETEIRLQQEGSLIYTPQVPNNIE